MNRVNAIMLTTAGAVLLGGCAAPSTTGPASRTAARPARSDQTPTGSTPYHGMIQYRAKDSKQAIVKPELVDADEAMIAPGTKVIGVFIGGEARAYPLFILNNHQVVNDRVGGIPLSASW